MENESSGYYVLYCEGPGLPLAAVHLITTHKMIRVLYDTRIQRGDKLSQLALPTRRSFEVVRHVINLSSNPFPIFKIPD